MVCNDQYALYYSAQQVLTLYFSLQTGQHSVYVKQTNWCSSNFPTNRCMATIREMQTH